MLHHVLSTSPLCQSAQISQYSDNNEWGLLRPLIPQFAQCASCRTMTIYPPPPKKKKKGEKEEEEAKLTSLDGISLRIGVEKKWWKIPWHAGVCLDTAWMNLSIAEFLERWVPQIDNRIFNLVQYRKTSSKGAYGHDPFWSVLKSIDLIPQQQILQRHCLDYR